MSTDAGSETPLAKQHPDLPTAAGRRWILALLAIGGIAVLASAAMLILS